ncbi:MAG TPA: hypothetical protein ENN12_05255 [Epsilonproteobacteria bacterium]|nr:hypothetical protein [Campylobacterota bacterium]
MKYRLIVACFVALGFGGCISPWIPSPSTVALEGETKADEILASDTIDAIKRHAASNNCNQISKIEAKVLKVHSSQPDRYKIEELWSASGCEQTFDYNVLFTSSENGGTTYTLKPL